MVFANFNYQNYPLILVTLEETIKNEDEFNFFCNKWLECYENKKDFTFLIDTRKCGYISIKYAYKMSKFINHLKKNAVEKYGKQWLKQTIFIVKNNFIMILLKLIFSISSPVAPVYITDNIMNGLKIYKILLLLDNKEEVHKEEFKKKYLIPVYHYYISN